MTIYSQHPSNAKVHILATYRLDGVTSSTVTDVDDPATARRIVDALNRVSSYATVPLGVWDRRTGIERYPHNHLDALADASRRPDLLRGAHSLWYEHIKVLLHQTLSDLDEVIATCPEPVRAAVLEELQAEERELRAALAESCSGVERGPEFQRGGDLDRPFIALDGMPELDAEAREAMDLAESDAGPDQLSQLIEDLRTILDGVRNSRNDRAKVRAEQLVLNYDPDSFGEEPFYLDVSAPTPRSSYRQDQWEIRLGKWTIDNYDDAGVPYSASGESVLRCNLSTRPTAVELTRLLDLCAGSTRQLAVWSETPEGRALSGTSFTVTERYETT